MGTPPGTQTYSGALLAGAGYAAQLFGGPTNALAENLRPLLPATPLRTGDNAGYVVPPINAVSVGDVSEGQRAKLQLRAWDNRSGTISNWLQVLTDPTIPHGESLPFISQPLGGLYLAPANLAGLESFSLATGAAPETRIRINFQATNAPTPPGYLPDLGLPFGDRGNGQSYGWNFDNSSNAIFQNATNAPDPRFASYVLMDRSAASVWEIAVTNGVYRVHMAAGDPANMDGVYRIEAEGILAVNGTPLSGNRWVDGDAVVDVEDGKLTVRSSVGSFNNRLCFVDITPIERPVLTSPTAANLNTQGFQLTFPGETGIKYRVQNSVDFASWQDSGPAVELGAGRFSFTETSTTPSARFYRSIIEVQPAAVLVYSNDFESGAGSEWMLTNLDATPVGARHFLGRFGHTTNRFTMNGLPTHTKMQIAVDLFVIQSWDGSGTNGPDTFDLNVTSGPVLLSTTFLGSTTNATLRQSYPGAFPGSAFAARTGAAENDSLGYSPNGDSVYHLSYTFAHSASSVEFNFVGGTTESLANESWGLSHVLVYIQDSPY